MALSGHQEVLGVGGRAAQLRQEAWGAGDLVAEAGQAASQRGLQAAWQPREGARAGARGHHPAGDLLHVESRARESPQTCFSYE